MKIGAFCRTGERNLDEEHIGFEEIKRLAVAAEAAGFASFWLPDHLIYRPHEPEQLGCWETFTFLSALARETSKILLGSFVAATSFRNPALLAKMADSLDELSGGRFVLGVGAGNWEPEHSAFGYPFDHRATRFEEAMRIIGPLLRQGAVNFQGTYHRANNCILRPRGPSPSGPPIWAGAKGERMLRIIAESADAYIAIWPITPSQVAEQWKPVTAACREVGREPETLQLTVGTFVHPPENGRPVDDPGAIRGTYEEIADQLQAFAFAGVDHLIVDFRPDISVEVIEEFGQVLAACS
ncbi:MAG TPA: LLM class flavin-dependent oxidoreductase [Thermomicrobiaceae bacterium]|nr:LLM class flavin-dependent oxidoreductase [Thermomicrobiaceae bacterium]